MEVKSLNYDEYIKSAAWYGKREARRAIDKSRCRTCGSSDDLECHHVTYERFGNEDIENDLITLCKHCHKAITDTVRRRRYQKRKYKVNPIKENGELNHVTKERVSLKVIRAVDATQCTTGRSVERVCKSYESYISQKKQD